jgi:hypothetical protein
LDDLLSTESNLGKNKGHSRKVRNFERHRLGHNKVHNRPNINPKRYQNLINWVLQSLSECNGPPTEEFAAHQIRTTTALPLSYRRRPI